MLRLILVFLIIVVGAYLSLQSTFYALLFYLWNAYFRPETWVWHPIVANLDLSFWIGVFLVVSFAASARGLFLNGRLIVMTLFLVHSFISTVLSQAPDTSWGLWTGFAKIFVITFLLVQLVTDVPKLRLVLVVIALSLGFESAKQGWVEMIRHPGGMNLNWIPFLGDRNGVATGLLMLAPILGALSTTTSLWWERYVHRFFLVGIIYRALSTYSRGGFVAALALGGMYLVRARRRFAALVAVGILAFGASAVLSAVYWERMETITSFENEDESIQGRFHFWNVAVRMGNDNPITGCGFHAFEKCYDGYDDTHGEFGFNRAVHSSWFGVFAELGYTGFALYVFILLSAIFACRRVRRMALTPEGADLRQYASGLEMGLWVFVVGGTFLSYQYHEIVWHFIGLTIVLERIAAQHVQTDRIPDDESGSLETEPFPRLDGDAPFRIPGESRGHGRP